MQCTLSTRVLVTRLIQVLTDASNSGKNNAHDDGKVGKVMIVRRDSQRALYMPRTLLPAYPGVSTLYGIPNEDASRIAATGQTR